MSCFHLIHGSVVAALFAGLAWCAPGHVSYLPLVFTSDDGPIRTNACLQLTERNYPQTGTWQGFGAAADGPEKAMDELIAVFKRKDRDALFDLSDPVLGRDPKQFDDQAKAWFSQIEKGQITDIPKAYEFGPFVAFFGRLHLGDQTFSVPFIFHRESNGALGFLPYRTNDLTFKLLLDWFDSQWGPSKAAEPSYCPAATISQFNFRVPTSAAVTPPVSYLYLKGTPASESKDLSARVNTALQGMKSALSSDNWIDAFEAYLTPEGAESVKQWYRTADQRDKAIYKQSIKEQEPFFIFDAFPLVITYTKSTAHSVQVMYFAPSGNSLLWTNSTLVTVADQVFKKGPLYDAAKTDKPFSSILIK
jgi:hypothetical protein